jgi:hypothetical protein
LGNILIAESDESGLTSLRNTFTSGGLGIGGRLFVLVEIGSSLRVSSDHNLVGFLLVSSVGVLLSDLARSNESGLRARSDSGSFTRLRIELHGRVSRGAVNVEFVSGALLGNIGNEVELSSSNLLDGGGNGNRGVISGLHLNVLKLGVDLAERLRLSSSGLTFHRSTRVFEATIIVLGSVLDSLAPSLNGGTSRLGAHRCGLACNLTTRVLGASISHLFIIGVLLASGLG